MAVLKGKGAMTGINLIARVYDNAYTHDGKSVFADLQIDHRDAKAPGQTNLHLRSERQQRPNGSEGFDNNAPYSVGQMDEIKKIAGDNAVPLTDKDGKQVGTVYGFKGNLMQSSKGSGLVVNTKSIEASEFVIDDKIIDAQFASMREAREARAAAAEKTHEAPAAVAEQAVEAEANVQEPAVG